VIKTKRIDVTNRVPINIGVRGEASASESYRIRFRISSRGRIIVPIDVVEGVGFLVAVLSGEPQIEVELPGSRRIFVRNIVAERISVIPLPFYFA